MTSEVLPINIKLSTKSIVHSKFSPPGNVSNNQKGTVVV